MQQIAFGGYEYFTDIFGGVVVNLGDPSLDILKGSTISDGVGKNDACGSFVVGLSDVLESLLSCSVPNLELVLAIGDSHGFDFKVHSDSGDVGIFKIVFAESCDDIGLANSTIPNYNNFGHEVIFLRFLCLLHLLFPIIIIIIRLPTPLMDEHNISSQSVDIKEFFSQVTNVSPEPQDNKSKYGSFTSPEAY